MLREGIWSGGVGSYAVPQALHGMAPAKWPVQGWYRLTLGATSIRSAAVAAPGQRTPDFLRSIGQQVQVTLAASLEDEPASVDFNEEVSRHLYLRVPGLKLAQGSLAVHVFKNGTPSIVPQLNRRYTLVWGKRPFSFSVSNGFRAKNGALHGQGAQYTVEYGGNAYTYDLGGYGWGSSVLAITDLDGDGRPDFLINVNGANSALEAVLLSSQAKPGKNAPTASLAAKGC